MLPITSFFQEELCQVQCSPFLFLLSRDTLLYCFSHLTDGEAEMKTFQANFPLSLSQVTKEKETLKNTLYHIFI